ncbi:hypothetical protein DAPPUDRAFT_278166, partial [Daphnia pulex]
MNTRDEDIADHARPTNPGYGTNIEPERTLSGTFSIAIKIQTGESRQEDSSVSEHKTKEGWRIFDKQLSLIELTTLTPVDAKERTAPSANAGQKPRMGTSKNSRGKNVAPAAVSRRSSKTPAVKPKTSAKPAASISALPAMPAKQKRSLKKRTEEEYDMGFCDISLCSKIKRGLSTQQMLENTKTRSEIRDPG